MRLIEVVLWARVLGKMLLIVFIGLIGLMVLTTFFKPTPPIRELLVADMACGALPDLKLPATTLDYSKATVKLLVQRELYQSIPPVVYVYRSVSKGETFVTKQRAADIARAFGFNPANYTKPTPVVYLWSDARRVLKIDASTLNFEYYLKESALPPVPNPDIPPDLTAKSIGIRAFRSFDAYTDKVYTFRVYWDQNTEKEVDSLEEARGIRVDGQMQLIAIKFPAWLLDKNYQGPKDNTIDLLDLYTASGRDVIQIDAYVVGDAPFLGGVQAYVIKNDPNHLIDSLGVFRYNNWQIEQAPCGTYEIIPPEQAFSLVKDKKAALVYAHERGGKRLESISAGILVDIIVTNIYLAYYQPTGLQGF